MKYESPKIELITTPEDTIMSSALKNTNILNLWDMLVDDAQQA